MLFDLKIFSGGVYPPSATSRTIFLFLFPIVFGINKNAHKNLKSSPKLRFRILSATEKDELRLRIEEALAIRSTYEVILCFQKGHKSRRVGFGCPL